MTGMIDRYAVMGEHLHYNPNFETDRESTSPEAVQSPGSDIAGNLGYLDVEAHNPTNEMVFTLVQRGEGETTDDADFEFEVGMDSRPQKGSKKPPKDKPIDLNLDDGGCLSCECCSEVSTLKIGTTALAVMIVVAGAIVAVLLLLR